MGCGLWGLGLGVGFGFWVWNLQVWVLGVGLRGETAIASCLHTSVIAAVTETYSNEKNSVRMFVYGVEKYCTEVIKRQLEQVSH